MSGIQEIMVPNQLAGDLQRKTLKYWTTFISEVHKANIMEAVKYSNVSEYGFKNR